MSQGKTTGVSGAILVCGVLASGGLFGVAALVLLRHLELDPSSVRTHLATGQAAALRLTLAWWAWWLVAALAFLVGRLSATLIRVAAANWWLFRDLRLICTAGAVLALAAIGHLSTARPDVGGTADAAIALGIVALATVLAALGAHSGRAGRRDAPEVQRWRRRSRAWSPVGSPPPVLHGGSVNAGLPSLAMRRRGSPAGASTTAGRRALAVLATAIAVGGVSALGSTSVMLTQNSPQAVRKTVELRGAATGSIHNSMASRAARAGETVGASPDTSAPPPPPPVRQPAEAVDAFAMATPDENELTFAKGYARRRAAREAAGIIPAKPPVKALPEVKRGRADPARADRPNRVDHAPREDFQRSFGGG